MNKLIIDCEVKERFTVDGPYDLDGKSLDAVIRFLEQVRDQYGEEYHELLIESEHHDDLHVCFSGVKSE